MSGNFTNFPPRSYSSSFYSNSLAEDEKTLAVKNADVKKTHLLNCFISMMKLLALLSVLHLTATQDPTKPTECDLERAATRVFRTPLEYQGTNSSFDPRHPSYRGNVVEFASLGVEILSKNFFVSFGSDHIVKLSLHDKGVTAVQDGAFLGLFCLQELDLANNNITALDEGSFEGLQNLQKLDLSGNALVDVPDDGLIFVTLGSLKELDLSHNRIENLKKFSFMTQAKLEILDLGFNRLRLISRGVFDYLSALKVLKLEHNHLSNVSPESWKGLCNLESLNLAGNHLRTFDPAYNFSFVSLRSLNLSGNSLSTFDALGARRHFPKMASLDLTSNSWSCDELAMVKHHLYDSKITLTEPLDCGGITAPVDTTSSAAAAPKPPSGPSSKEIVQRIGEMGLQTRLLEQRLEYVESMLVYLFVMIALLFAVYMAITTGLCRMMCDRSIGGNRRHGYFDNDETVLLTRR